MGGTIGVESEPGVGSTFHFEIPAEGVKLPADSGVTALAGRRVMILSKNAVESDAIARTIVACGGSVRIATTSAQASTDAAGCDTIFVDAALEDADGRLIKRLRDTGFADADAVTLISPTDRGMLGEFRAAGYQAFLARPVRGDTLLRTLLSDRSKPAATATPDKASARIGHAHGGQTPGLSILIAEDNDINAMLARATLVKAGHRVEVVGNGKAAVDAVTLPGHDRYDVVLMDLHMPVMDGLDAIGVIRRHEEDRGVAPVPIMVLSADSQEKTRHHVLAHGASGFVTKPLDPDALIRAVEEQAAA
jgi:CheY-like chemotaxis protein